MGETYVLTPPGEGQEGEWTPIPDQASLRAKLLNAKKRTMPFKEYDSTEDAVRIEWTFQIEEDGAFLNRKVKGLTGTKFVNHPDCRMYQWAKTLMGVETLPEGFQLDLDDLTGQAVVVQVNQKEGGPRKDGPGNYVNNNVIDVRPSRESVSVASSAASEEPF